jgi:hypothetical protein
VADDFDVAGFFSSADFIDSVFLYDLGPEIEFHPIKIEAVLGKNVK